MNVATVLKSQWDRIAAVGCVVLGLVLLIHGYRGIANSPYVAEQLAYLISEGLGGMFALGVGATLYVSADLHDEWRKLDRIEEAILRLDPQYTGATDLDARFEAMVAPVAQERARRRGNAAAANSGAHVALRSTGVRVAAMPREMLDSMRVTAVAAALALLGLVLTWWRAAEAAEVSPAFTATAVATLVFAIAGIVMVLSTVGNRRRLMRRRTVLLQAFLLRGGPAVAAVAEELRMPERLLVIPDGRFAHAPGCTMLGSEPTRTVTSDALPEGIVPCALCTPAGL
jgi:hypothetical protein